MPYKVEGGRKFSDHHVQSPRFNVANSCQQCHRQSEKELIANIDALKVKITDIKNIVEEELVKAHFEAKAAWDLGASEAQMAEALQLIRHGQWRWDYSVASHGGFFHAPEEALRILATALKKTADARRELAVIHKTLKPDFVMSYPDVSTKEKAQAVVGVDYEKLEADKKKFLNGLAKDWWENNDQLDPQVRQLTEPELRR